jgi:hypothetical protein
VSDPSNSSVALLPLLRSGGYDASLMTTYAVGFDVYEQLLLRKLIGGGCRYNILLADHRQTAAAWAAQESRPATAGVHYILAPMRSRGAFHPKIWLLAGSKKAALVVGSHNITYAGLGYNDELTSIVEVKKADGPSLVIAEAWRAIEYWIESSSSLFPGLIKEAIFRFQEYLAPFTRGAGSNSGQPTFLAHGCGSAAWSILDPLLPAAASRVGILGPFHDVELRWLAAVNARYPEMTIALGITPQALTTDDVFNLPFARPMDARLICGGDQYVHAKALYIEAEDGDHLLAIGSANPSAPAWLADHGASNAEAMLVFRGQAARQHFHELGLELLFDAPAIDASYVKALRPISIDEYKQPQTQFRFLGMAAIDTACSRIEWPASIAGAGGHVAVLDIEGHVLFECEEPCLGSSLALPNTFNVEVAHEVRITCNTGDILVLHIHHAAAIEPLGARGADGSAATAFRALLGENPDIEYIMLIIQRVLDDAGPILPSRPGAAAEQTSSALPSPPPKTLQVTNTRAYSAQSSSPNSIATGDLGELIDVLMKRISAEASVRRPEIADHFGRSEEELAGTDDEATATTGALPDDALLADRISRKVRRLCAKLGGYLLELPIEQHFTEAGVLRIIAVVAVVRELVGLQARPRWNNARLVLVPPDSLQTLFEDVVRGALGSERALLRRLAAFHAENTIVETSQLQALLLWLAFAVGARYSPIIPLGAPAEREQQQYFSNAALFALLPAVARNPSAEELFDQGLAIAGSAAVNSRDAVEWKERHFQIAHAWREFVETPFDQLPWFDDVRPGAIAVPVSARAPEPLIVARVDERFVTFASVDGPKSFSRDTVVSLG